LVQLAAKISHIGWWSAMTFLSDYETCRFWVTAEATLAIIVRDQRWPKHQLALGLPAGITRPLRPGGELPGTNRRGTSDHAPVVMVMG
jgi:hypothetical protein